MNCRAARSQEISTVGQRSRLRYLGWRRRDPFAAGQPATRASLFFPLFAPVRGRLNFPIRTAAIGGRRRLPPVSWRTAAFFGGRLLVIEISASAPRGPALAHPSPWPTFLRGICIRGYTRRALPPPYKPRECAARRGIATAVRFGAPPGRRALRISAPSGWRRFALGGRPLSGSCAGQRRNPSLRRARQFYIYRPLPALVRAKLNFCALAQRVTPLLPACQLSGNPRSTP